MVKTQRFYHNVGSQCDSGVIGELWTPLVVDAEIVSIDTFNKSPPKRGLVVGITFIKVPQRPPPVHTLFLSHPRVPWICSKCLSPPLPPLRAVSTPRTQETRAVLFLTFTVTMNLARNTTWTLLQVSRALGRGWTGLAGASEFSLCPFCRELPEFGTPVHPFPAVPRRVSDHGHPCLPTFLWGFCPIWKTKGF